MWAHGARKFYSCSFGYIKEYKKIFHQIGLCDCIWFYFCIQVWFWFCVHIQVLLRVQIRFCSNYDIKKGDVYGSSSGYNFIHRFNEISICYIPSNCSILISILVCAYGSTFFHFSHWIGLHIQFWYLLYVHISNYYTSKSAF